MKNWRASFVLNLITFNKIFGPHKSFPIQTNQRTLHLNVTTLTLPTTVLPAQWFIYNVKVSVLSLKDKDINVIEPNAFNGPAFNRTLIILKLYMPLETLKNGTFNGLKLRFLELANMKLHIVETDALVITKELESLYIEDSEFNITNLRTLIACLQPKLVLYELRNKNY